MSLIAVSHLRDIGTGATRPQLFLCGHDGEHERWVLKLMGNANAELAADWVGCLLAHRLGIRCPEVEIASVSQEALDTAPANVRSWAKPGPAFASREVVTAASEIGNLGVVNQCDSDFLGSLYALDTWLEVVDRRKPEGMWNVLLNTADNLAYALDFGKSLSPCVMPGILASDAFLLPNYPATVKAKASVAAAVNACSVIEGMAASDIREIAESVPHAWRHAPSVPDDIVKFLAHRQPLVRKACENLHDGLVA